MYDLADVLPDAELESGTNLLITGPPLSGKRRLALDILADGTRKEEGAIVVTTKDSGDKILSEYRKRIDDVENRPLGVVDCVTKQRGVGSAEDGPQLKYASSPVDMTGIGIKLSEFLQDFYERRGLQQNRVLMHSVSTLLMYSDLQTVFRFLHVFTGRVQSANGLGLYVIDSTAHDDQTMNTLTQLFDGVVELSENDAEPPRLRTAQ
ncbi:RAD55 family ATPase [Natranaeroarchaeum sulfidigenes]|uniref:KaiC-like protein ATPase n=1 Tax=Natranaeroarchaeum sulfidigenes TaxID=2784880 RepID=A0A897MRK6_9EURY|nr:recombinase RecA [Natranaeroarchaeum sulfidigenes]QSG03062.1 KaiC-like protein ATPase [Natranaeroarchaeum sulfidigenes]